MLPSSDEKDEHEEFEIIPVSIDELEKKINTNEIFNGMTLASWALARKVLS